MSDTPGDAFLGVECSLLGRRWQARLDAAGEARAAAIAQANGLDDILARVLAGRGVGASDAPAYLNPKLRELMPEPLTLRDMDRAVDRFAGRSRPANKSRFSGITTWTAPARRPCWRNF